MPQILYWLMLDILSIQIPEQIPLNTVSWGPIYCDANIVFNLVTAQSSQNFYS